MFLYLFYYTDCIDYTDCTLLFVLYNMSIYIVNILKIEVSILLKKLIIRFFSENI